MRLFWMPWACKYHLAPDIICQERKRELVYGVLRSRQCLQISSTQDPVGCLQLFPSTEEYQLVKTYFQDLQFCVTTQNYTTTWHLLKMGMASWQPAPSLLWHSPWQWSLSCVSWWLVEGEWSKEGLHLPPKRACMDDIMTVTTTKPNKRWLLQKLQNNINWAWMELKPTKSRRISIVKGQLTGEQFYINDKLISTILERSVQI